MAYFENYGILISRAYFQRSKYMAYFEKYAILISRAYFQQRSKYMVYFEKYVILISRAYFQQRSKYMAYFEKYAILISRATLIQNRSTTPVSFIHYICEFCLLLWVLSFIGVSFVYFSKFRVLSVGFNVYWINSKFEY